MGNLKHAYYSKEQLNKNGKTFVYLNSKKEKIYATEIFDTKMDNQYKYFKDNLYVGEVEKFVEKMDNSINSTREYSYKDRQFHRD